MLPLFRRVILGVGLTLVLSLVVLSAQGADPWIGTWTFVSGHVSLDPTPQIAYTLEKNGFHFVRKNAAGQDEWTAQPDGKTYPWTYNEDVIALEDAGAAERRADLSSDDERVCRSGSDTMHPTP
jgi:hypothetical protein